MESKLEAIMALAALLQVSSGTPVLQQHNSYIQDGVNYQLTIHVIVGDLA